jgi:AcrR family transcriptional regulator
MIRELEACAQQRISLHSRKICTKQSSLPVSAFAEAGRKCLTLILPPCLSPGRRMPLITKKSLRRDRIVHAAGQLFAHQGYHGTSTRQIAHLAEMSENTLFRYFEDKESLFWVTLGAHFGTLGFERDLQQRIANCEPPEVVLPKILELFADTASYRPQLLRLAAVAYLEMHPRGEAFLQERFSPFLSAVSRYLEANVKGGKIRDLDPVTATVALAMTALTFAEVSPLINKDKPLLNHQEKNRAQARFWLDVLAPRIPSPVSAGAVKSGLTPSRSRS